MVTSFVLSDTQLLSKLTASGVDNYYVYYNINGGTNVLAGTTSSTNFTLNNVNADSTYCFVIKSVSGDFNDTANSNKECVFTSYPLISDTNYLQTVTVLSENQYAQTFIIIDVPIATYRII